MDGVIHRPTTSIYTQLCVFHFSHTLSFRSQANSHTSKHNVGSTRCFDFRCLWCYGTGAPNRALWLEVGRHSGNSAYLTTSFSPACQAAVIDVLTVGDFAVCFPAATVLPGE